LFLIYYKDTDDVRWLIASGIYLSIAVLTKYPAVLVYPALMWVWFRYGKYEGRKRETARQFSYVLLPLLPSLLWLFYAITTKPTLTAWYFNKPEAPWSLISAKMALYLAVTKFIPEHFGYVFYIPFVLIFFLALKDIKTHGAILLFTLPWLILIFAFPNFYLANMYYHYTMLYGMAVLLGFYITKAIEKIKEHPQLNMKLIGVVTFVLVMALSLNQYNVYFHGYYTNFTKVNETRAFESAKYVAEINTAHELVVVDFPMTMFYAGADPAYVKPAYYNDGILDAIKEDKYSYFVIYYSGNATIRTALKDHNYTRIAPLAWYKNISDSIGGQ
jgi:4-amino-4-deoxy-L-arabinose transferase-like glycosyltransferase